MGKLPTSLLVAGGLFFGIVIGGTSITLLNASRSKVEETPATPEVPEAPPRWMLTFNGGIVSGDKFDTEAECEKVRQQYIENVAEQAKSEISRMWGKGMTMRQYPYYQQDLANAKIAVQEAQATYCRAYSI